MRVRLGRGRRAARVAARFDRDGNADLYAGAEGTRLLVVLASGDASHDSGAVAIAVARCWGAHGRDVLFVDADASGSGLAIRLGAATRSTYSPASRGLPSLMAARRGVSADLLREHCWRLDSPGSGEVSLLLGPTSRSGAPLAAAWLAERTPDLVDANTERSVIASMTTPLERAQITLLRAASAVVVIAPADSEERIETLRSVGRAVIEAACGCSPCLVIDGSTERSYEEILVATGLYVAGRLEDVPASVLLRNRSRRRDLESALVVEELAARIAFLAADDTRMKAVT
ncbi:hypothetical protein [Candidatus Poriferisodalis sp.]|uniref:hypothetical protein n=1 Tax=Candidatus Poriferisodalis sp. TaxID=3101277 RepID=UPI003B5AD0FA